MHLDVRPGLYALRYVSSVDVRTAPSASVRPVAASVGSIDIVSAPGSAAGALTAPGASAVIVVSAPGTVEISLTAFQGSQNLDARFSLDLLSAAEPQLLVSPMAARTTAVAQGSEQESVAVDLVAHVSRRGDIRADEEGWIAGPRAPSSIEALQIMVRGRDVGVAAQFRNVESRAAWSPWLTPGAVIGVPKRACALTGLRLNLVGTDADRHEIVGEALFLGTPKASSRGRQIEFVAPGELDPLIGLKLSLVERAVVPAVPAPERVSRVRVFR